MISNTEKEALEVIEIINNKIYEQSELLFGEKKAQEYAEFLFVSFHSNGWSCSLMFNDIYLWDSDNDPRSMINENTPEEDFEPLLGFIERQLNEIFEAMGKLSF